MRQRQSHTMWVQEREQEKEQEQEQESDFRKHSKPLKSVRVKNEDWDREHREGITNSRRRGKIMRPRSTPFKGNCYQLTKTKIKRDWTRRFARIKKRKHDHVQRIFLPSDQISARIVHKSTFTQAWITYITTPLRIKVKTRCVYRGLYVEFSDPNYYLKLEQDWV